MCQGGPGVGAWGVPAAAQPRLCAHGARVFVRLSTAGMAIVKSTCTNDAVRSCRCLRGVGRLYAVVQTVAWCIKAPPFPAPQAVSPENLPDHQATSWPEPNGSAAPEPDKIAVCEGNANFDMHTRRRAPGPTIIWF